MQAFTKTVYEECYLYHEFKRLDGKGWLGDNESVQSVTVTLTDKDSGVAVAGMISGVQPYGSTKVVYKVVGGTAGRKYIADIKIVTDQGQKFEDKVEIRVTT